MFIIVDLHTYDSSILNKILLKHTSRVLKRKKLFILYFIEEQDIFPTPLAIYQWKWNILLKSLFSMFENGI